MMGCAHSGCGCYVGASCCLNCPLAVCIHDAEDVREKNAMDVRQQTLTMVTSGMSVINVAAVQGITRNAVYARLRRARA